MSGITGLVETTFGSDPWQVSESQTESNSREVVIFWIWGSLGRCKLDKRSYFQSFLSYFSFLSCGEACCQNPSLAIRKCRQSITHLVFMALCIRTNNTPLRRKSSIISTMGDIGFWEVVSHFPSKILCYNISTVWKASEPLPVCQHHGTSKVRLNGASSSLM